LRASRTSSNALSASQGRAYRSVRRLSRSWTSIRTRRTKRTKRPERSHGGAPHHQTDGDELMKQPSATPIAFTSILLKDYLLRHRQKRPDLRSPRRLIPTTFTIPQYLRLCTRFLERYPKAVPAPFFLFILASDRDRSATWLAALTTDRQGMPTYFVMYKRARHFTFSYFIRRRRLILAGDTRENLYRP
jgi:hypothetical protein